MKTNGLAIGLTLSFLLGGISTWAQDATNGNFTVTTNATGVLPTKGTGYVIVEQKQGDTDSQRGQKLLAAYAKAKTMRPGSTNRIAVLIPPGNYDLGYNGITLDTDYIDLIGSVPVQMTARISQLLNTNDPTSLYEQTVAINPCPCGVVLKGDGEGVIVQTASNLRIADMIVSNYASYDSWGGDLEEAPNAYFPISGSGVVEHVRFQSLTQYPMDVDYSFPGVYRDCVVDGIGAFGYYEQAVSGTFEDCVAGSYSFGCWGTASGTFRNCSVIGVGGFAGNATASGTFENCYSGDDSFGADCFGFTGNTTGRFINCVGGQNSFANITTSAVLTHCKGGAGSFGSYNVSSGDFNYGTNRMDLHIQINPQGDLSMGTFTQ